MNVARAPNHLGDGVMALPALAALARQGALRIQAPQALAPLYRHLALVEPPSRTEVDTAVLFTPSLSSAWLVRRCGRRIGTATDARGWLLTDRIPEGTHRRDTYADLARAAGAIPEGAPSYPERGVAAPVPLDHVGLNPLTKGGPTRTWTGFAALAARLGRPVVFYGGPGEERALRPYAHLGQVVAGLSLPDFAATLQHCSTFVSNDTGPAHFARAVGVRTVVLHLSTDAAHTGAAGAVALHGPRVPCAPCYNDRCTHGLECTQLTVDAVLATLRR